MLTVEDNRKFSGMIELSSISDIFNDGEKSGFFNKIKNIKTPLVIIIHDDDEMNSFTFLTSKDFIDTFSRVNLAKIASLNELTDFILGEKEVSPILVGQLYGKIGINTRKINFIQINLMHREEVKKSDKVLN